MISEISKTITKYLIIKNIVPKDEFELYHYGLFVLLSDIFTFCYCLLIGIVLDVAVPSLVCYFSFCFLHRFAGGLHLKTELHCMIITLLFFLIGIILVKYSLQFNNSFFVATYICCTIILVLLTPADTPQKPLSCREKKLFKKIISLIVIIGFFTIVVLNSNKLYLYSNAITVAVFLQSLSVVCGRLFNKKLLTNKR